MDIRTNEDEPTEAVENLIPGVTIMTMAEYLRTARTLSQEQVDQRNREHHADDLSPQERASYDVAGQTDRLMIDGL